MSVLDEAPLVEVHDRDAWRRWLEANHTTSKGAWMVTWRSSSGRVGLAYEAAVEEALCFGWVDSTGGRVDDERSKLYFAPRKARSPWSASNKARVERLVAEGLMAPAGLAVIEQANANGYWTVLDSVVRLEVPDDLAQALAATPSAAANFAAFPASVRKQHLAWIALAGKPETRSKRIEEIADKAARNERARS